MKHVDALCRHLAITSSALQPWDVYISEAEKTSTHLSPLQGETNAGFHASPHTPPPPLLSSPLLLSYPLPLLSPSPSLLSPPPLSFSPLPPSPSLLLSSSLSSRPLSLSSSLPLLSSSPLSSYPPLLLSLLSSSAGLSLLAIRQRFFQVKLINQQLSLLLPLIDLRSTHPLSLGRRLASVSPLLFYDVKISFFHSVLNASTRRSVDQAPPEIKMDPLESVGSVTTSPHKTHFCHAAQQMLSVPSPQLCVALASGGDPTYAFNVKLAGEEVHGTSKPFRLCPLTSL